MENQNNILHGEQIKKIINDTVMNFYKQPVKFSRNDTMFSEKDESHMIRDLVNEQGPMSQKSKTTKSVGFDNDKTTKTDKSATTKTAKLMEVFQKEEVDLGNEMFNEMASDIRFARERLGRRILEKSPEDDRSNKSIKKKGKKKDISSTNRASIHDSVNISNTIGSGLTNTQDVIFNNVKSTSST